MIEGAVGLQQFVGIAKPDRTHGMILAQFVVGHGIVINKSGTAHS
jgi:hypothetical protein